MHCLWSGIDPTVNCPGFFPPTTFPSFLPSFVFPKPSQAVRISEHDAVIRSKPDNGHIKIGPLLSGLFPPPPTPDSPAGRDTWSVPKVNCSTSASLYLCRLSFLCRIPSVNCYATSAASLGMLTLHFLFIYTQISRLQCPYKCLSFSYSATQYSPCPIQIQWCSLCSTQIQWCSLCSVQIQWYSPCSTQIQWCSPCSIQIQWHNLYSIQIKCSKLVCQMVQMENTRKFKAIKMETNEKCSVNLNPREKHWLITLYMDIIHSLRVLGLELFAIS